VVSIESTHAETVEPPKRQPTRRSPGPPRPENGHQQRLDFQPVIAPQNIRTNRRSSSEPTSIRGNARPADLKRRVTAAVVDHALILLSLVILLATVHISGGRLQWTKQAMPIYGVAAFLLTALYRALWCIAGSDSPGLRWESLTIVDLDGKLPTKRQRLIRLLSGFISTLPLGLGLLWALVDHEKLTFHDHISATFPTPIDQLRD
jgi:uncharacterized RDD family membrane protein YckC